jgi:hypothetical protein
MRLAGHRVFLSLLAVACAAARALEENFLFPEFSFQK